MLQSWFVLYCVCSILQLRICWSLKQPSKVVIVGASSSVGYLTFTKLQKKKSFTPYGLVKDKHGFKELTSLGVPSDRLRIADITRKADLQGAFDGAEKVIICTSAVPRKRFWYRVKNFFAGLVGRSGSPKTEAFYYAKGQRPYEVDYLGQKNIIDECVRAKVDHIVLLGNMGGYKGSKLNDIGRAKDDPDVKNGNILKWKRASERYLMQRCQFTILHAAQFTDERAGQREVIWDTDDALLRTNFRKIPREDVAEVLVQALVWKEAIGRSIDISSRPVAHPARETKNQPPSLSSPGQGVETATNVATSGRSAARSASGTASMDWLRFWSTPGNCVYPADFDDHLFH